MAERFCLVVMGHGTMVAYSKGNKPRTLDLDNTYAAIIYPRALTPTLSRLRAGEGEQAAR
jgi:hypothetical protein